MSDATVMEQFGYFGKVPARGDFISDQLPLEFIEAWSEWLQAVMAVSREQLADDWLPCYLTSPVWHFALSPGVCGDSAICGTLMPSVDQVGRHYFFTLAAQSEKTPIELWSQRKWCQSAEDAALKVLEDDLDLKQWARDLVSARWLAGGDGIKEPLPALTLASTEPGQLSMLGEQELDPLQLLHQAYRDKYDRYCLWWTAGSERIEPSTLLTSGTPLVSQFAAMMDGNWKQWGW